MTEQSLPFDAPARTRRKTRPSLTDKLADYFRAHPNVWIPVTDMAALVGTSGVRQRRLECQQRGLTLERREWQDEDGRHHLDWRCVGAAQKGAAA